LKIIEDWKKAIDCNQYTAAVLMDLSKAFDCLPHDLLILILEAYGLSKSALDLMHSYLSLPVTCFTCFRGLEYGLFIQPLGPFLINSFHLPVGRYLVKILYPDFSNDCSIGSQNPQQY
jgi:hypothetical protein